MLLRLLPDQVKDHWDELKHTIYQSIPVHTGERSSLMNDLLVSILTERMIVWISYQKIEGNQIIDSVITTTFIYNEFNKTKNLLIYTIFGFDGIPVESWEEGLVALVQFAEATHCDHVIAYSDNALVLKQAREFNLNISNLITIPIGG